METQVGGPDTITQPGLEGSSTRDPSPGCRPGCALLAPEEGANSRRVELMPLIDISNPNPEEGSSISLTQAACGTPSFATPRKKKPQKYKHSVGGHHLLLSLGDGKILKECARREEKFYLAFERAVRRRSGATPTSAEATPVATSLTSGQDPPVNTPQSTGPKALEGAGLEETLVAIADFVPRFYGSEVLPEEDFDLLCESTVNDYTYDRKLRMLQIQDVTYGYERPCVLDLKMGSRQYGLNAPDRKVESKTRKSRESTSEKLGCRMSGWQKWVASEGRTVKVDKYQCRTYSEEDFINALRSFLNYDPALMGKFKQHIDALKSVFETQNALRLYTSSLLFVYDAARPVETARVFMVDFAYCYTLDEMKAARDIAAFAPRDEGYYLGLQALSRALSPSFPSSAATPIPVRDWASGGLRSQPSSLGKSPPPHGPAYDPAPQHPSVDVDDDTSTSAT